ncbi:hypothetical protein OIU84_029294 [Salix udensis]|uniref:Photosystem II protein I n=1 Tax=Salix udensis TaxID=889485 RepID=A0AAD6KBC2_9ROSI|nr:hypothetical protein OIU84_029294 [Salix udensis]
MKMSGLSSLCLFLCFLTNLCVGFNGYYKIENCLSLILSFQDESKD